MSLILLLRARFRTATSRGFIDPDWQSCIDRARLNDP
jgi:hypothetical protein